MLRRLSVKSKLLATVLGVSIASIVVVSVLSFTTGQEAISEAVLSNLTAQRESRAELLERYLRSIENQAATLSQDRSIVTATAEFTVAAEQLAEVAIDPSWEEASNAFYAEFLDSIPVSENSFRIAVDQYVPRDPVAQYLQHQYLIQNENPSGEREKLVETEDGSFYSRVHARFHPSLRNFADRFGFYDIFLIEPTNSRIVYSVEKEVDFGTSLQSGPWGRSSLADLVNEIQRNPTPGGVEFIDYDFYRPSLDDPAAFAAAPIFNPVDQQLIGVLAFQLPLDEVDATMTANGDWVEAGFGETGEAYIVGRDEAMRSISRLLAEDPDEYRRRVTGAGTTVANADAAVRTGNTILRQPVRTAAVQNALRGKTGTDVVTTYHGELALSSYGPLSLPDGLNWAIVTEQSLSEAEAPVNALQRSLLIATGVIVLALTALAMFLSARFVRPINALIGWTGRVGNGDVDEAMPVASGDEIGMLGQSVDRMVGDMRAQRETILNQQSEMQSLILNLMPPQIAERVTRGDNDVADAYPNVTIIWASLSGFSRFTRSASPGEGKRVLDEVIGSFDAVADEIGIEKIRGGSSGYIAACGLMEPRLDQRQRAMQFAIAIDQKLESLSTMNNWGLDLRVGVASGDAEAGIVGTKQIAFEVWGDPVSDAAGLAEHAGTGTVLVSADIAEAVGDRYPFTEVERIDVDSKSIRAFIWVEEERR